MTCPKCNGTGKRQYIDVYGNSQDIWLECELCSGKGYLTNDEWRKTCSAEEFAEWLSDVMYACMRCGKSDGESVCHIRQCILDKEEAVEWLKEKHNE